MPHGTRCAEGTIFHAPNCVSRLLVLCDAGMRLLHNTGNETPSVRPP